MIVDDGVVRYDLHRHEHGAPTGTVLLPPHIAHRAGPRRLTGSTRGCSISTADVVDTALAGRSSTSRRCPTTCSTCGWTSAPRPRGPGGALEAESRLALITDRIARWLDRPPPAGPPGLAGALRDLLDSRLATASRCARRGRCCTRARPISCAASAASSGFRRTGTSWQAGGSGPPPAARRRADRGCRGSGRLPRPVPPAPPLHPLLGITPRRFATGAERDR